MKSLAAGWQEIKNSIFGTMGELRVFWACRCWDWDMKNIPCIYLGELSEPYGKQIMYTLLQLWTNF